MCELLLKRCVPKALFCGVRETIKTIHLKLKQNVISVDFIVAVHQSVCCSFYAPTNIQKRCDFFARSFDFSAPIFECCSEHTPAANNCWKEIKCVLSARKPLYVTRKVLIKKRCTSIQEYPIGLYKTRLYLSGCRCFRLSHTHACNSSISSSQSYISLALIMKAPSLNVY